MTRIIRVRYGHMEHHLLADSDAEIKELRRLMKGMFNKRITVVTLADGRYETLSAAQRILDLRKMEDLARRRDRMDALRRNRDVLAAIAACDGPRPG